jgi:hypothetical protein
MAYKPKIIKPISPRKMQTYGFPNGMAGGMNCSVPADRIRPNQSPNMLNMCYDQGTPTQRRGFGIHKKFPGGIRGMHCYEKPDGSTVMLVAAGGGKIFEEVLTDVQNV